KWPPRTHGGNGRARYADVEAVRACDDGIVGHRRLLELVWRRYRLPLAITELHLGCTRDEQLRWLVEGWQAALDARANGCGVRAVTAWSLFGAYDWASLAVRDDGIYEPGAFDVGAGGVRPTALATAVRALATEGRYDHPVLDGAGWWRRDARLAVPA